MDVSTAAFALVAAVATGALEGFGDRGLDQFLRWARRILRRDRAAASAYQALLADPSNENLKRQLQSAVESFADRDARFADELEMRVNQLVDNRTLVISASGHSRVHVTMGNLSSSSSNYEEVDEEPGPGGRLERWIRSFLRVVRWVLVEPWSRIQEEWVSATRERRALLVLLGAATVLAQAVFVVFTFVVLAPAICAREAEKRDSPGWRTLTIFIVVVEVTFLAPLFFSNTASSDVSQTEAASSRVVHCESLRRDTGPGAPERFEVVGLQGGQVTVRTTLGIISIELDPLRAPCQVRVFRELVEDGFYDATRCGRLALEFIRCYSERPTYHEQGFAVRQLSEDPEIDPVRMGGVEQGSVLLEMDSTGEWTTGLVSFVVGNQGTSGVGPYLRVGKVTSGINILTTVVDAGSTKENFWSDSKARRPFTILQVDVVAPEKTALPAKPLTTP
jgi:cyclophilin family peptidyl-prolyl cis-trans isomerase